MKWLKLDMIESNFGYCNALFCIHAKIIKDHLLYCLFGPTLVMDSVCLGICFVFLRCDKYCLFTAYRRCMGSSPLSMMLSCPTVFMVGVVSSMADAVVLLMIKQAELDVYNK